MTNNLQTPGKRTRLPRHRIRVTVIVDPRLPSATTVWWKGKAATCVVRPGATDEQLGMLFRTLAIDAGATELDYS
jgi:hypothetical protein